MSRNRVGALTVIPSWEADLLAVVSFTILKSVLVIVQRSSEYSNKFVDMNFSLYLCSFTLILSTYTSADSEYILYSHRFDRKIYFYSLLLVFGVNRSNF